MSKLSHVKKDKMFFSTIFVVADQIYDIVLIVSLFLMKQFEFAAIFLLVDLLPGVNFINIFTYEFFARTVFRQLFLVTFWLWQKICTKNTRV